MNTALLSARLALSCGLFVVASIAFATPPSITQQPSVAVVTSGSPATFTVGASASAPLSYQWRHLGTPLANATGPTLTLSNVTMADAGLYDVVVTAGGESTVSQAGCLITTPTQYADQFCLDDSFLPLIETAGAGAEVVAADPITGGFYVGGEFSTIDGARRWNLARFDSAGNSDATFTPRVDGKVLTIAVQPDGKVLIGGEFRFVNHVQRGGIARLNTDGSLDRTFGNNPGFDGAVTCIGLQSTGRILVCGPGRPDNLPKYQYTTFLRLLPGGVVDPSFEATTSPSNGRFVVDRQDRILLQPYWWDGKLARVLPGGAKDTTFTAPTDLGTIYSIAVQSDGRPVIAVVASALRLESDGSKDPSYSVSVGRMVSDLHPSRIAVDGQDRAVVYADGKLIRILPSGSKDSGFAATAFPTLGIAPLSGGQIATIGTHLGGTWVFGATGALVRSASSDFFKPSRAIAAAIPMEDGAWLIAGDFCRVGGSTRSGVARILASGAVDPQFSPPDDLGPVVTIARQGTDRIVGYRSNGQAALFCLLANGSMDGSFSHSIGGTYSTTPLALVVQSEGKILVGGDSWLSRFNPNGTPDPSFAPTAGIYPRQVHSMCLQNDGKVLVGGATPTGVGGYQRPYLRRLLADGTADISFSPAVDFTGTVKAVFEEPDGTIVAGGNFGGYGSGLADCVAWLNPDGSLLCGGDGDTIGARLISSLLWQADGRVVVSGLLWDDYGLVRHSLLRLGVDGTKDVSFAVANVEESTTSGVCYDDAGRLLYSGATASRCGLRQSGLARLKPGFAPEPHITQSPVNSHFFPGENAVLQVQAAGTNLYYVWFKDGHAIANSDTPTFRIAAATLVDTGRYHVEASNNYGTVLSTGADLVITNEAQIEYYEWANANGLTDPHSSDGSPSSDPEDDGMANLLHYAFNIPRGTGISDGASTQVVAESRGNYLAVTFSRKTYAIDLNYVVEASSDLENWDSIGTLAPGLPAKVTVLDTTPCSGAARRFLRVRVDYLRPF